jgi:hypothetical protein
VHVLSANYIEATTPRGSGARHVTVTTPGGTSPSSAADRITYKASPSQCVPYMGSGYSTALAAG